MGTRVAIIVVSVIEKETPSKVLLFQIPSAQRTISLITASVMPFVRRSIIEKSYPPKAENQNF